MESNVPWPERDDDYAEETECTCGCNGDEDCHCFDPEDFLEHPYDDDVSDEVLIDENGGLTAEGFILLAELEASGAFV